MSMFKRTLKGHFSGLTDSRMVSDPWGIGFTVGVLRAGAKAWQDWKEKHGLQGSRMTDTLIRLGIKASVAQLVGGGGEDAKDSKKGFRQRRRATRAQQARIDPGQIISQQVDELPADKLRADPAELNRTKAGIAAVLMTDGWAGVLDDETGAPAEFSLGNRLRFVGWDGFLVQVPGGLGAGEYAGLEGDHFLDRDQYGALTFADKLSRAINSGVATVEQFKGNPRDENDRVLFVDEDSEYGPNAMGDAIALWLLDDSEATEEFRADFVEGAVQDSSALRPGVSAT